MLTTEGLIKDKSNDAAIAAVVRLAKALLGLDAGILRGECKQLAFKLHQKQRRLARLTYLSSLLAKHLEQGVSLCFGSRSLWRKQHHLGANGYADHGAWRAVGVFSVIGKPSGSEPTVRQPAT